LLSKTDNIGGERKSRNSGKNNNDNTPILASLPLPLMDDAFVFFLIFPAFFFHSVGKNESHFELTFWLCPDLAQ